MQLIRAVEINYFRSIYQLRIAKLKDINVFTGGNDSGKSNILRALNLFFNNKISDSNDLDFLQDVTHSRQSEARDAKGRLTIWIKVTFENVEKWKSLPEIFSVKKVWNRYSNVPEVTYDIENSNNLQRFLNKINFIYVPAIRDNYTYAKYLRILYETISSSENVDLKTPASSLSNSVNEAIKTMSDRIAGATGVNSTIDVPADFRDLFERLSFSTMQDEFSVPLRNRGDGLQARHIPHIVEFICGQNKKNNIWGYEEPENSLEMTKSFEVAKQFSEEFCERSQIFVTSHSPSFYGLEGDNIEKFYVSKAKHGDGTLVSKIEKFRDVALADQQLGIAHIISDRTKEIFKEIEVLKSNLSLLRSLANPVIITEGKHDKAIIESALQKTGRDASKYNVMCCERMDGEGGGATTLKQTLENIPSAETNIRFGIFDRDQEGIAAFESLKKFKKDDLFSDLKRSPNGRVFGLLLPENSWDDPYFELAGRQTAIEQMFARDIVGNDIIAYRFDVNGGTIKRSEVDKLLENQSASLVAKLVRAKIEITNKTLAAERIIAAPVEAFETLDKLLKSIDECISQQ
jgi:predicted ATPase